MFISFSLAIREAIWIRKRGLGHDDGTYSLNHVHDQLLEHREQPVHVVGKISNNSKSGADVSSQN